MRALMVIRVPPYLWCSAKGLPGYRASKNELRRIRQLEQRLSQALGEQTWRESGLGAPTDIDTLHQRISQLEQHNLDLQQQLDERDEDLAAARAANRELMARLNTPTRLR
jgi:chromosome segregation ATPase